MSVGGIKEMERKYTRTFPRAMRNALQKAMGEATEKVVQDMRLRAPVYSGPPSTRSDGSVVIPGALRASIGWTFGDAPKGAVTLGSVQNDTGYEVIRVTIYAGGKGAGGDAFYARWVEHGTVNWPQGNPFFYGTWRDHRRRWRSAITRAIRKEIKRIADA